MVSVKMIAGAYGHRIGKRNILRLPGEVFSVEDEEAKRLVSIGVATIVDADVATPPEDEEVEAPSDNTTDEENATEGEYEGDSETEENEEEADKPEYSVQSSMNDLRAIGKQCGITFKVGTTKEEMVAALDDFFSADDDGEELNLDAESPV